MKKTVIMIAVLFVAGVVATGCKEEASLPSAGALGPDGGPSAPPPLENPGPKLPGE